MRHTKIIAKLNLEQKCALLSGETVFTTRDFSEKGIPAITLSDGPNGVRKQAGAADHLGLNPSVPATCFPTSATVANSWDPALGEAIGHFGWSVRRKPRRTAGAAPAVPASAAGNIPAAEVSEAPGADPGNGKTAAKRVPARKPVAPAVRRSRRKPDAKKPRR